MMQERKKCFKCNETKPLTSFYKHKAMSGGRVNKCKECNKLDVRNNRISKVEYYREYDRARGNRQGYNFCREYRAKNPNKYKAHTLVGNAIRSGKLVRGKCEVCGISENIHAHHDDYLKPLEVRWLCSAHHRQWHVLNGEAKNSN